MKEKLKEIQSTLKSPESRSKSWAELILNLSKDEQLFINQALLFPPEEDSEYSIERLDKLIDSCKEEYEEKLAATNKYIIPITAVIERLKTPVNAFLVFRYTYERMKAEIEMDVKVRKLVEDNIIKYKSLENVNKERYIIDAKSMVTIILFQPPMFTSEDANIRSIIHEVFKDWNPTKWVLMFCEHLNNAFDEI